MRQVYLGMIMGAGLCAYLLGLGLWFGGIQ